MTQEQIKEDESVAKTPEIEKEPKPAKRSPLIAIVSIVVALALIATAVMVLFTTTVVAEQPYLSAWTSPSQISVDKGEKVRLIGYAVFKNNTADTGTNMSTNTADLVQTVTWDGTSLGTLTRGFTDNKEVTYLFESKTVGTSKIKWTFTYTDANNTQYKNTTFINVTVGPATLSYVEITPASGGLLKDTTMDFTAQAFMTDGTMPVGVTYAWSLDNPDLGTISPETGNQTTLTAASVTEYTYGNLTCTATLSGKSVTGVADILVMDVPPPSSTTSRFYDIFGVPMKDYWSQRNDTSWFSTTYPYREIWSGSPAGNVWMYGNCRMNISARNISNTNTLHVSGGKPWYVPVFGSVKGGTIWLDWHGDYLTLAEAQAQGYPQSIVDWFDGWFWKWWGTITMDKTAAKMVTGMTNADFDNFNTWKANDFPAFKTAFSGWLADEAEKWGVYYCYEYPYNALSETYDIEKVGDKIVFHIVNHLSWGMESLMGRWWSYTFLPYEYWPEDVHFTGTIMPMWSDFDLTMAMQYNFYAWNSTKEGKPSWIFETVHADAKYGSNAYYQSQLNNYYNNPDEDNWGYWCRITGNAKYGQLNAYDYTPWYWNLGPNDKIIIEWPEGPVPGYQHVGTNDYTHIVYGNMTPRWVEPLPTEAPGVVDINMSARTITFSGPFNMLEWSKNTINARELHENWTRISDPPMLPHGVPWVEFVVNTDVDQKPIVTIGGPKMAGNNSVASWNGSASWDLDGTIVSYSWDWGDGSPAGIGPIGSHTYHAPYTPYEYIITLTVTDDDGLTNTDKIRVTVVDNFPPVAQFSAPKIAYAGVPVEFNASASYDLDNSIASYEWDFGDGNTATGKVVNHTYTQFGVFTVSLTVTDNHPSLPLSTTKTEIISVSNKPGLPLAKMYLPSIAIVGESVQLTGAMSSAVNGSSITSYAWNFGDSSTGSGVTVSHAWSLAGTYNVTLTVTDNHSNVSVPEIRTIQIVPSGAAGIGVSLSKHALKPGESTVLTVSVVDATGDTLTSFNGGVAISSNASGYSGPSTLALTNGVGTTSVSFSNAGAFTLTVTNSTLGLSGKEFASVADRTIEFTIYDIMSYPLGNWWDIREVYYSKEDEPFRYGPPAVEIYRPGAYLTEAQVTTTYRMSVQGEDIPEIRITNPTFVPRMNPSGGTTGNASYHLTWQYMTLQELQAALAAGKITVGQYNARDGWEYYLVGNLTMDRAAAAHLIGLPVSEPDVQAWFAMQDFFLMWEDPGTGWWANESSDWLGNTGRLDIRASDDAYPLHQGYWNSMYESLTEDPVSGNVTLNFWRIGYGEDILIMRQLYWGGESYGAQYPNGTPYGILPFECWLEDFDMTLNISETSADVDLDFAVAYGWRAWKSDTAPPGVASWRWENIRSDYMEVVSPIVKSEMDLWSSRGLKYTSWDAGSSAFGKNISYDYAPNVWNMVLGEVLVIKKPTLSTPIGYLPYPMIGNYSEVDPLKAGYYDSLLLIEKYGDATLHAVGCPVGTAIIDAATGDLKIAGPFEPIKVMTPGVSWLLYEPAPRIEIWVQ